MKEIKCLVWDLDNTIWNGVLLEDKDVTLKDSIKDIIIELDRRGVLQSIASKNDFETAFKKLEEYGISEYFLYPQINWNAKSNSIKQICDQLNISLDSFAFIDDQEFERDEVIGELPSVYIINAENYKDILANSRFIPRFITVDSSARRLMYQTESLRKKYELEYKGPKESFLSSLNMKFRINCASEYDLKRAEELTIRTNQLNATGRTYSYDELNDYRLSNSHELLICELEDRYGSYGKIGLALIEFEEDRIHLKLLLMSCRVMSRGVGTVLLTHILNMAKKMNKKLFAEFVKTGKNELMYITYKFANFTEFKEEADQIIFENDLSCIQEYPKYIDVIVN